MPSRRLFLRSWLAVVAVGVAGSSSAALSAAEQKTQLAIAVAKDSPLGRLSSHELKRLFLGENVSDPSGTRLVPLNQQAKTPPRVGFERGALGMSSDEVGRYWIDRKIRGQSGPPKSVPSVDLLRRLAAKLDGAVIYVAARDVSPELKLVRIDGKVPGDSGYRLEF